jgi:hypothetical protein
MKLTIMEEGRSCHDGDGNAEVPIYDQDDICVASVWGPNDKETRAIAYKMAAAQELYDVCKYALSEQYGHTAVDEYLVDALETAIAKAEGKEAA